ncbi:MAG: hypothetical protein M3296_09770 [Actinomycetota bacterium]|nr:hypothetical protein [Actinomycetota bacterium]
MVSTPLTVLVVATAVGLTGLFLAGISYAAAHPRTASAAGALPALAAAAVVLGWSALVLILSAEEAFATDPDTTVPVIAAGIVLPIVAGWRLHQGSWRVRALLDAIPLRWVIGLQLYRVLGALFLVAYLEGRMPAEFALPAGVGDVLVGIAAPVVAAAVARKARSWRSLGLAWNVVGIADLVVAVTLGVLTSPSVFQQLALDQPNELITRYPFVLVPTFAVPASILLHLYALSRLRRGRL